MSRFWVPTVCLAWGLTMLGARPASAANVDEFLDWSLLRNNNDVLQPGRLFVPRDADDEPLTRRPLVVFLHGLGEGGSDNTSQVNGNIDNLFAAAQQHEFSLLAPQSFGGFWGNTGLTQNVMTMLDNAIAAFDVDTDRVYVTGLSAGGGGAWNFASREAERFAAAVPIAGIKPSSDFDESLLVDKPIWAFHARNDTTVGEGNTRRVIDRILTAQGEDLPAYPREDDPDFFFEDGDGSLRYSESRLGGHSIWGRTYADPALYDWLLAQSLGQDLLEGDHDGDGFVSQADLNLVLLNWGADTAPDGWVDAAGFDGAISQNELNEVLLNWGGGQAPGFNAIPEPWAISLMGLGGIALAMCRRR
ncbi:MAG: dienelactone hydrolase family protein [Planctomycetota bacterium]